MENGHTGKNCRGVLRTYKNAIFAFETNSYLNDSHSGVRITLRCIDVFYEKCVNLVKFLQNTSMHLNVILTSLCELLRYELVLKAKMAFLYV